MMYKAHLSALVRIRRRLAGHKKLSPWTTVESMRVDLADILHESIYQRTNELSFPTAYYGTRNGGKRLELSLR
jgi:hypothetical protein